ncbi:MAG: hypothetical protein WBG50_13140 [Desulfomonilaceae bacterium]
MRDRLLAGRDTSELQPAVTGFEDQEELRSLNCQVAVPVFMIARFLTSNWFAALILIIAAGSLIMLYTSGRTTEAVLGAGLLFLALVLILMGVKKGDGDR